MLSGCLPLERSMIVQPPVREPDVRLREDSIIVRPAMPNRVDHASKQFDVDGATTVEEELSRDATHRPFLDSFLMTLTRGSSGSRLV